jgi:hypothetical protein
MVVVSSLFDFTVFLAAGTWAAEPPTYAIAYEASIDFIVFTDFSAIEGSTNAGEACNQ